MSFLQNKPLAWWIKGNHRDATRLAHKMALSSFFHPMTQHVIHMFLFGYKNLTWLSLMLCLTMTASVFFALTTMLLLIISPLGFCFMRALLVSNYACSEQKYLRWYSMFGLSTVARAMLIPTRQTKANTQEDTFGEHGCWSWSVGSV